MPTSRATRVTSEVNTPSCLIIVLTMVAERRNSPLRGRPSTSSGIVLSKSPCATAVMARVTSVVGHTRSSIRALMELSISPQAPLDTPNFIRCFVLPSRPTTSPTRSSCLAIRWLAAMISLKVSAILPSMPMLSPDIRIEKSPTRMACKAASSSVKTGETWSVLLVDMPLATAGIADPLAADSVARCITAFPPGTLEYRIQKDHWSSTR